MKNLTICVFFTLWSVQLTAIQPPLFDLSGTWQTNGSNCTQITVYGATFSIDMSAFKRQSATGEWLNDTVIRVAFQDPAETFVGIVQKPNLIKWSNGTIWRQLKPIFNVNGIWMANNVMGPKISFSNTNLLIDMTAYNRQPATGEWLNDSTIRAAFQEPADTVTGILQKPNIIKWSNGGVWTQLKPAIDLEGIWMADNKMGPIITMRPFDLLIDMSAYQREPAIGMCLNETTIHAYFTQPGEPVVGNLQKPNRINWSNGSYWIKFTPILDLNGVWMANDKPIPATTHAGYFNLDMSVFGRPAARGIWLDTKTISVEFFAPAAKLKGTLQTPNRIKWSNGTVWEKKS